MIHKPNLSNDTLFQFENFQSSKPVHFFELWNRNSEAINCSVGGDFRSPHWSRAMHIILSLASATEIQNKPYHSHHFWILVF